MSNRWSEAEIVVLCALFSMLDFYAGDDSQEECSRIADVFGRSTGSIDMQWRNVRACVTGKSRAKIGADVSYWAEVLAADPKTVRNLAEYYCELNDWNLLCEFKRC